LDALGFDGVTVTQRQHVIAVMIRAMKHWLA